MRYLFTLLIALFTGVLYSQHSIGLTISSGIANQTSTGYVPSLTQHLPTSDNRPPKFYNPPVKEEATLGYSITINYEFAFYKKFALYSGVSYSKSGFRISEEKLLFESQYVPGRGYILPAHESYDAASYNYKYAQISIPLGVNYYIPYKNVKFFAGAGVLANYLLDVNYDITLHQQKEDYIIEGSENLSNYSKVNFSALGNLGVEFSLFKALAMRVFSSSQYTFTNIAGKDTDYKIHPYSTGLSVSVLKNL